MTETKSKMKRTVKVNAWVNAKISTGAYENETISFSIEETIENANAGINDEWIKTRHTELNNLCYENIGLAEKKAIIKRIEKEREDIRFYEKDGVKYPSVTSVLNYDTVFEIPKEELLQYAAAGTINHLKLNHFILYGKHLKAKEIPEAHKYISTIEKGNLRLDYDGGSLSNLLAKYPIKFSNSEETVYNDEFLYAGTFDALGLPIKCDAWDKLNIDYSKKTLFDLKRNAKDKDTIKKYFKQMAAYSKCIGAEQMVILIVNDDTERGFSEPKVSCGVEEYFSMFKQDRQAFKERFGI